MPFDLILRGGRVIDPSQKLDAVTDVAFSGGKVAAIGSGLRADPATEVRDVSQFIVTPGLIDLHTHVYWGGTSLGIDAEEFCRASGVTTSVDTGSAGPGNFAGFRKHVIEPSQVRILAYLHVSHAGIFGFSDRVMVGESEELRLMNPVDAVRVADANRDLIVGIKVRVGLFASGTSGLVPLEIALEEPVVPARAIEAQPAQEVHQVETKDAESKVVAPVARLVPENNTERFYKENIEVRDGSSVTATELYEDYCSWCEAKNKEPAALPSFAREFAELGVKKEKVAGRVRYIGIALKSDMALEEATKSPTFGTVAA